MKTLNTAASYGTVHAGVISSLVFVLVMLQATCPAWSILVSPTDGYKPAVHQTIDKLRSITNTKVFFEKAEPKIFTMTASARSKNSYVFVRFETKTCGDVCPNAIFKGTVSENSFVAFAVLPRKSAVGDAARGMCRSCLSHFPLIFQAKDEQGRVFTKHVYLTDHGLVF